jgi:hypothetical protein
VKGVKAETNERKLNKSPIFPDNPDNLTLLNIL